MAMNIGSGSGDPEVMIDINTTPLIDVMLVLLIMLIITIPMQTHAVKLDMPTPAPPTLSEPPPPPPVVDLEIDFDGSVLWNGELVADRAALEARLQAAAQANPQPEVHLRPNRLVEYKYVAAVLASTQRLGITNIGFVGTEQLM